VRLGGAEHRPRQRALRRARAVLRALVKQRYGARFGRLDITEEAKDYMIDPDSISSVLKADFEPT